MEMSRNVFTFNYKKSYNRSIITSLFMFQIFGILLAILSNEEVNMISIYLSIAFVFATLFSNIYIPKITKSDSTFILIVNMLYSISVIMIMRLSSNLVIKHIIWYLSGLVILLIVYYFMKFFDKILKGKFLLFFIITTLTFIVTLALGFTSGGAKNWIDVGGLFSLQLSEFGKISFIFMIASYYYKYDEFTRNRIGKYYLILSTYIFALLFFLQGELGTAMIFFGLLISNMFIFEKRYIFIVLNIILALVGVYLASLVLPHIKVRIDIWLDPWKDFNERGYQIIQSLFAIASGGFFGTGIGLGMPDLVPVVESDFILTAIIEEMGMFMGFSIILMYILLFYKTLKLSLEFSSKYYSSLSLSIGLIYAMQALIMFGGILKLIPLTGITTPFLSYGGSSTVSNFILLSILQYLSQKAGEGNEKFKK
ncbi:FtsW/RodA/SpoVE family cell cycle protein [Helcococcus sueciensis]|uniref:FtsW/RodA/SpoVE family cell cycle protein n=1 Tax=Helcococcus sueciensis TaxID=241555 RepID=UPI0003F8CAC8|nr:FtsW/RodA/SpoVE family cell cycle protein [Helcococcus sueciensis]